MNLWKLIKIEIFSQFFFFLPSPSNYSDHRAESRQLPEYEYCRSHRWIHSIRIVEFDQCRSDIVKRFPKITKSQEVGIVRQQVCVTPPSNPMEYIERRVHWFCILQNFKWIEQLERQHKIDTFEFIGQQSQGCGRAETIGKFQRTSSARFIQQWSDHNWFLQREDIRFDTIISVSGWFRYSRSWSGLRRGRWR